MQTWCYNYLQETAAGISKAIRNCRAVPSGSGLMCFHFFLFTVPRFFNNFFCFSQSMRTVLIVHSILYKHNRHRISNPLDVDCCLFACIEDVFLLISLQLLHFYSFFNLALTDSYKNHSWCVHQTHNLGWRSLYIERMYSEM